MKPGREYDSCPVHENFLCPGRAWFLLLPSWKCSLEVYVCCSLINKNKINLRNHEFVRKKQNGGWKVIKWPRLVLFFFLWSELIRVQLYFIFIFLFDPSWSDPDWRFELIRSDFCNCLAKMFVCPVPKISHVMMKWCRRATQLGRFTLWHYGRLATQLSRFTLWHNRR